MGEAGSESAVGRVLGTEDATPLNFWVALAPDQYLQLDDVVVPDRAVPGREPVTLSGVVSQVRARHDDVSFSWSGLTRSSAAATGVRR